MSLSRSRKFVLAGAVAVLLAAALLVALHFSPNSKESARQQLLQLAPIDSSAVIYLDLDEFKQSPFLAKLYSWAPRPIEDSEYAQFVRDTGFSYERDLKRVVVAISGHGAATNLLAVVEGKFDRKKIELFLSRNGKSVQQGKRKVFILNASSHDKPLSLAFLSDDRFAISDSENFSSTLSATTGAVGYAEWNSRFERLSGTPLFAVLRQDSAMQAALNSAAPGGFRSPQLSTLLDQLQWISIAGKPEGDQLRVVAEGECLSEPATSQLRDFLQGVLLLAQNGLNDPKLRQQMNPEEREAYLDILKRADIQKINRGEWKSVRLVLSITPKFLDVARVASIASPQDESSTAPDVSKQTPTSNKPKKQKKN
jgi:hypothetical protein